MCVCFTTCSLQIEDEEKFKYRIKVINPKAKKELIVIDWHGVTEKFTTVADLKEKLVDTLSAHLPELSDEFNIGYFHGRPQTKSWILSEHDLQAMYGTGGKEILLWCDGKSQDMSGKKRKKTNDDEEEGDEEVSAVNKRTKSASAEEKELEEGIHKLQSIHADNYDYGQYRLWARMMKNNRWKDFNNPPNLPMITGKVSRKDKGGNTVVDTLATAAVAIIKELKKDTTTTTPATSKGMCTLGGMSPGKKVELRSQYLKQLKEIQNLKDEGVLTLEEFQAEKDTILQTLKGFK